MAQYSNNSSCPRTPQACSCFRGWSEFCFLALEVYYITVGVGNMALLISHCPLVN